MSVSTSTAELFQHGAQARALLACVAVSVVLHALALFAFPDLRPSARSGSPGVLVARFAPRLALPEAGQAAERELPKPPEPPRQEAKPETPRPVLAGPAPAAPVVAQEAAPAPVPEPNLPVTNAAQTGPPAEVARAPESQAPVAPSDAAFRSAREAPADATMLRQYLVALVSAANLYKRYPPQARDRGWEGRVEIRLVIDANGTIKSAAIKTSSNYQLLDDQALDMVKKGKPRVQIPAALRGREFTVDVPVIFELQTG